MKGVIFAVVLGVCWAAALKKKEKMETRDGFSVHSKPDLATPHEIVFAVKQRNLDVLHNILMERSSPNSAKYQQWLSFDEVGAMTSNPDGAAAIKTWLASAGISVTWESAHQDYMKATASVGSWEILLSAEFQNYRDSSLEGTVDESTLFVRATEYSIPEELDDHIHALFNTVQPPPVINRQYRLPGNNREVKTTLRMKDLMYNQAVTPAFLNSFYGITSNIGSALQNQSVFETSSQYFSPNDLTQFQTTYQTTVQPAIAKAGYTTNQCSLSGEPYDCFEGNLDVQYIMGVSQVTSTVYWYVGGNNPFVDWITDVADEPNPPQSNSISWGTIEQQNSPSVLNSFNTEALKLSAMGVTIMVSTGDNGVANFGCPCNSKKATTELNCACQANSGKSVSDWTGSNTWTGTGYFPSFPATCPYVTAVGATMFSAASTKPELTCQSQLGGVITTGGGFSTYYAQPSWQTEAVDNYFAQPNCKPSSGYNPKGRGIPDVSLLGVNYKVIVRGTTQTLFGTSASAPVLAGMISLINAGRLARGLPNVGFINPTLYQYGLDATLNSLFNDVTSGHNGCCANGNTNDLASTLCCTAGFNATVGWDAATGWGSVDFTSLADMLNGAYDPTAAPTARPSISLTPTQQPTPTPLPSRMPSQKPSPLPGAPTFQPTVTNIVQVAVSQAIIGAGLTAVTFNSDPSNALSVQESVIKSINNTQSVVITAVVDYTAPTATRHGRRLQATGVLLNYTVEVNDGGMTNAESYASITNQITTSVDTGAFTSYLNSFAAANGATVLLTASSDEVVVSSAFIAPTAAPVASPSGGNSNALSSGAVAAIVVVLLAVFICVGTFAFCRYRNRSSNPSNSDRTTNKSQSASELPTFHHNNPISKSANTRPSAPPAKPQKPSKR